MFVCNSYHLGWIKTSGNKTGGIYNIFQLQLQYPIISLVIWHPVTQWPQCLLLALSTKQSKETLRLSAGRGSDYSHKGQTKIWLGVISEGSGPYMFWSHVAKHMCIWPKHFMEAKKTENIYSPNTNTWSVTTVISTWEDTWWQIRVCRSSLLRSSGFDGWFCVFCSTSIGRVRTTAFMVILFLF